MAILQEVHNEASSNDCDAVVNITFIAADNAAATIEEKGGTFERGNFNDEFLLHWEGSVSAILSSGFSSYYADDVADWDRAVEWFKNHGIEA